MAGLQLSGTLDFSGDLTLDGGGGKVTIGGKEVLVEQAVGAQPAHCSGAVPVILPPPPATPTDPSPFVSVIASFNKTVKIGGKAIVAQGMVLQGSQPGNRLGHLWPWGEEKAKPTDEEMAAAAPDGDRLTMTGTAGTMIFCDTSGFHRGGFAKTRPRVLSIWSYISAEAENRSHRFDVELEGREAELSADARAALA